MCVCIDKFKRTKPLSNGVIMGLSIDKLIEQLQAIRRYLDEHPNISEDGVQILYEDKNGDVVDMGVVGAYVECKPDDESEQEDGSYNVIGYMQPIIWVNRSGQATTDHEKRIIHNPSPYVYFPAGNPG